MQLNEMIKAFSNLKQNFSKESELYNQFIRKAINANGWYTEKSLSQSIEKLTKDVLNEDVLYNWSKENQIKIGSRKDLTIGLVTDDKTPFEAFKDVLTILLFGYKVKLKQNDADDVFYKFIYNTLKIKHSYFEDSVEFSPILKNVDAYILNGLVNSDIVKKYFNNKPCLNRHKTASLAILSGSETQKELDELTIDICLNFGLGRNNVAKLLVPTNWDPKPLLKSIEEKHDDIKHHHKYKNNYDYQLSLLLVNGVPHFATENILLKESKTLFSPTSTLFYQHYNSLNEVEAYLEQNESLIQNIYSNSNQIKNTIPFGSSTTESLNTYPANINTVDFLKSIQ